MLVLDGVSLRYGRVTALVDVTLSVGNGERLTVLGPSGAGKSSLLRAIAGLEPLAAGRIRWDGRDLRPVPVHARGFGLMFQDYVLFPHRDVAANVGFGLRMRGDSPEAARRRVTEVLEMVGLTGYERRAPVELSGGEQQRVALARALAPAPRLLMLDEPLGALDRTLRQRLLDELSELFRQLSLTILYVTHDREEALSLGDRVALMRGGKLETVMPPEQLWHAPPTEFAARFLGLVNIADARIDESGQAQTPWGSFGLTGRPAAGEWRLLVRPNGFRPADDGPLRGVVARRIFHGDHVVLRVVLDGAIAGPDGAGSASELEVHADWPQPPAEGDAVRLAVDPRAIVLLPKE
jgi:thiamine transport system ATP-binding protein